MICYKGERKQSWLSVIEWCKNHVGERFTYKDAGVNKSHLLAFQRRGHVLHVGYAEGSVPSKQGCKLYRLSDKIDLCRWDVHT